MAVRHPHVIAREQRAMIQARTARRHRRESAHEDARDTDPIPIDRRDREIVRVVRLEADGRRLLVVEAMRSDAVVIANREPTRCLVITRSGKTLFDNRRDF
jgi:hypothetical protein